MGSFLTPRLKHTFPFSSSLTLRHDNSRLTAIALKAEKFSRACLNLFFLVTAQSTVTSKVVEVRGYFLGG